MLGVDPMPKFGLINDIIALNTDVYYIVYEVLVTECFAHHFHSYKTYKHVPKLYECCKLTDIYDYTMLSAYTLSSQLQYQFIPLKYQLF